MRRSGWIAVAVLWATASPGVVRADRPVTIDAVLQQEGLGQIRIDPKGRWIVVERRASWDAAATYRFGLMTTHLLSTIEVHDLGRPGPPRRLADPAHASGYVTGPIAPNGEKMVVYRLTASSLRLGVMTLATGEVRWFPVTPEYAGLGRTVDWRSNDELVLIARPDDDLPLPYRLGRQVEARKAALWRAFDAGRTPSATAIPSGVLRDQRVQAAPSRLLRLEVGSGRTTPLASGELVDLELSPDGRRAAILGNAEDLQADEDDPIRVGTPSRRRQLALVDLEDGRVRRPLKKLDVLTQLLSWSPDGTELLVFAREAGAHWSAGQFWRIDHEARPKAIDIGEASPWLTEAGDGVPVAQAGWDETGPVVQVRQAGGQRAWRLSSGAAIPLQAAQESIVRQGGRSWIRGPDGMQALGDPDTSENRPGRSIPRARASDGGARQRWNPTKDDTVLLTDGCVEASLPPVCLPASAIHEAVALSDARPLIVRQRRSAAGSVDLDVLDGRSERRLVEINPDLAKLSWGRIEPVRHESPGGAPLTSWLLIPPGARDGEPLPTAVILYPGAAHATPPEWLGPGGDRRHINPAVIAAHGYAVLVPSLPRVPGSGPGLRDLAERLETIIQAASRTGYVDPNRVALIGHSYGGLAALLATTQTRRFRAVVASAGYTDLSRTYALTPHFMVSPDDGVPLNALAGWSETGQGRLGSSLAARPDAYVENSPLYLAQDLTTPALLIEGDLDPAGGDALFGLLYRLNREAALVTYAGEGHLIVSPANLRDLHGRILAWLDRYLRPLPASQKAPPDASGPPPPR